MKKIFLFLGILLLTVFSSCDAWNNDLFEFLEHYSSSAEIERYELDAEYPSVNGVTHLSGETEKQIRFYMQNSMQLPLDFAIQWTNSPLGGSLPEYGVDYTLVQAPYNMLTMTLTPAFLANLEADSACGDISATIFLSESENGRDFLPYSYVLMVNTQPPKILNAQFAKAKADSSSPETWWVCFNAPENTGIHTDINAININDTIYNYTDSRFKTEAPSGLIDTLGNTVIMSGTTQRYLDTGLATNKTLYSTLIVSDSKGLSSLPLTIYTGDIPTVMSPVIHTDGALDVATGSKTVTISTTTADAAIYYTIDGSTPTASSTKYTTPFTIDIANKDVTLKAIALKTDMNDSLVVSQLFTKIERVAAPTISSVLFSGINGDKTVTITSTTDGSAIFYTTDESDPATSIGGATEQYTAPFTLTPEVTIKAIATKTGMANSEITTYKVSVAEPATPPTVFPATGSTVLNRAELTLTSAKSDAIYYTKGIYAFISDSPTENGWYLYDPSSKPEITFFGTEDDLSSTYRAIAIGSDMKDSAIISATYHLKKHTVTFDANGGTGSMDSQTFKDGYSKKLTVNSFVAPSEKEFGGWSTVVNGVVEYTDEEAYTATADVTLYAVWKDETTKLKQSIDGYGVITLTPQADGTGYSLKELLENPGYYNRDAVEIVILEPSDGSKILPDTDLSGLFSGYPKLKTIRGLEEYVDTSRVTNMSSMFSGCAELTSLALRHSGAYRFSITRVTNMDNMFSGCTKLEILYLDGWGGYNLTSAEDMFSGCDALTKSQVKASLNHEFDLIQAEIDELP